MIPKAPKVKDASVYVSRARYDFGCVREAISEMNAVARISNLRTETEKRVSRMRFSILLENLRINGGMENAQALCVGASDCVDQVRMYEHPESLGGSQAWPRENWDKSAAVTIDLARLDSIFEVEKVVPVMKMETQGFEVRALRGCAEIRIEKLFITYAPRMIEGASDDPREFRSLLASRFHSLRRIDPKSGPCEVRWDDLDATARKGEVSTFFDIVCEGAR